MNDDRVWDDWPACTQCGRPRQTVCPTCGNAGNAFDLAEYQALAEPQRSTRSAVENASLGGGPHPVLLLCPRCDEAFRPRFYRTCPACGCDAGNGIDVSRSENEPLSSRTLLAMYGLIAVLTLTLLYFWFLFRGQ